MFPGMVSEPKCDEDSHIEKEDRPWKEYQSCERLFKFPRSSLNCEIVFNGYYIIASSKGLKMDLLVVSFVA